MAIDKKTEDYKSHKYKRNVYVEINPKTKEGQNLLRQYHEQTSKQFMDIGRIGYHDEHGRYKIDYYTLKELKVVPKLIIRVIKSAMNRAGKDVYELRTYMSKFGQLNFLLTVDSNYSELILVENIYITNLNHRENYETPIWRINHHNERPIPLKQIFYEYGIKANPEDYGKSWSEDVKINNLIVAKAKAEFTIKLANSVGSSINQKALVASLNNLNASKEFGKKINKAYSEKVVKKEGINKLASSPKLENTLNQVLVKTLEEKTDKKDLKNKQNLEVYKKVVNIQFSVAGEVNEQVEKDCTKASLKDFMLKTYEKTNNKKQFKDEKLEFDANHAEFEKIIDFKFSNKPKEEKTETAEEKFNSVKFNNKKLPDEYRDFENKKIEVDLNTERFLQKEDSKTKKAREKEEKLQKAKRKKEDKLLNKKSRRLKRVEINCNIDEELEKSKILLGIEVKDKRTIKQTKKLNKKQEKKEILLAKIERKIKRQNLKLAAKKEKEQTKKQKLIENKIKKQEKKKKKKRFENQFFEDKKPKTKDENLNTFRPVVKEPNQQHTFNPHNKNWLEEKNKNLKTENIIKNEEIKKEKVEKVLNRKEKHNEVVNNYLEPSHKKKKEQTLEM